MNDNTHLKELYDIFNHLRRICNLICHDYTWPDYRVGRYLQHPWRLLILKIPYASYRKVFIYRLHPYPDHISHLLPGGSVLKDPPAAIYNIFRHKSASPWLQQLCIVHKEILHTDANQLIRITIRVEAWSAPHKHCFYSQYFWITQDQVTSEGFNIYSLSSGIIMTYARM